MSASASRLVLPGPLQGWAERAADAFIRPPGGPQVSFTHPVGEPALAAADSVSWKVFKNPLALFVGGVAAVLLELAEPRVRAGVWDHTSFRTDPVRRLQRTGLAAMVVVYGARSTAEALIAGVGRAHARVSGRTADGVAYRADDPELLDWVQATASFGFLEAYCAFVQPLPDADRDRFYAEAAPAARLFGAHGAPTSTRDMAALFDAVRPRLGRSDVVFEFLAVMRRAPILPPALRPAQGVMLRAAVEIVPGWARELLGLDAGWRLRPWESRLLRSAGALADRVKLDGSPPVQACLRLGLPADALYAPRRLLRPARLPTSP